MKITSLAPLPPPAYNIELTQEEMEYVVASVGVSSEAEVLNLVNKKTGHSPNISATKIYRELADSLKW